MLYDIKLTIDYSYDAPTDHARNVVRLLPGDFGGALGDWHKDAGRRGFTLILGIE